MLAHCPEKVAEYDAAAPSSRAARLARPDAAPAAAPTAHPPTPPLLMAPSEFRLAAPSEVVTGPALVGRPVLFYWPTDGGAAQSYRGALACRPALLWLICSLMPLRPAGGAVGAALPCALAPAPLIGGPTVTAFRAGQAGRAGKRELLQR